MTIDIPPHEIRAEAQSSIGSVHDLRTGGHCFDSLAQPIFFPRIDDGYCERIHSSVTALCYFKDGYVGKQPVSWEEYCAQ